MNSDSTAKDCLTVEELAIKSLRELIPDVISANEKFKSNLYLLQWLKVEKLNPEKTEVMIRKSMEWRQENQIMSEWKDEGFLKFKKTFGFSFGVDKHNCPVGYMPASTMDYRKGISFYGKKTWVKYWSHYYMFLEDLIYNFNNEKNVDTNRISYGSSEGLTIFVDVKDFPLYQIASFEAVKLLVENLSNMRNYFPALTELCIYINMNKVFKSVFKVMKPIITLPYLTLEVYGSSEKEWRDRVLQIIDETQLNEFLES
ncbi:unnamed protein product [Allacma fusca]|uniref:CRAL-TRIO domain-containing protein n=1 Tax=Allacma fusca TaxID=39272 RepID=A0A8J2NKE8_9HEXA|nr:unnamed protein product [Allacma fusca]